MNTISRWHIGRYDRGAAYPEGWIRIEETGGRLVANLPPYRAEEAQAIVQNHNAHIAAVYGDVR
jgi:hypothetical protein